MSVTVPDPPDETTRSGSPRRRKRFGRQKIGHINLDKPPTATEVAEHNEQHKGDAADRLTLYNPKQIEEETRDVKLCITFGEPIRIRDQAEMVIDAMEEIIELTKKHDLGTINQRLQSHHVAKVLGRALTRFNGKTPYGEYRKKR